METMRLSQLHRAFLSDLAARGARPRTVSTYTSHFALFLRYIGEDDLRAFREDLLLEYPTWLSHHHGTHTRGAGCTPNTIHAHLASLRSFTAFLARRGDLKKNPMERVPKVLRPRRLPRQLPLAWLDQMQAAPLRARDRAILLVSCTTGLRREELVNLDLEDVDFGNGVLVVREGKGGDDRALPLAGATKAALLAWLEERGQDPGPLFLGIRGGRLRQYGIGLTIARVAKAAGLPHITPHQIRHTWATEAINEGVKIQVVQAALGHKSLETTARYLHVTADSLKEGFARLETATLVRQGKNADDVPGKA